MLYRGLRIDGWKGVGLINIRLKRELQEKEVVTGLVRQANRVLVEIRTHHFPFDFFPDTIKVEEEKVTVTKRWFIFSAEVYSVDLANITNVLINTTPFFAQLVIVSKTFEENTISIRDLWINDAVYVRRIIEGMRTMINNKVDTSVYTKSELIAKLEELSNQDKHVD